MKSCVNRDFIKKNSRNINTVIKYTREINTEKLRVDIGRESICLDATDLSSQNIVDYFNAEFERINAPVKMEF
tara:strand:- start:296 stop:514 length:219 start_codon:yes stop_codon:yes gene_type:complete